MPNHIHLVLDLVLSDKSTFQQSLLRFTANQCLKSLKDSNSIYLNQLKSTQNDRKFHFWERNPFWTHLRSEEIMVQKMQYIHLNPVRKEYLNCKTGSDYFYSSAKSYSDGIAYFDFLNLTGLNHEWSELLRVSFEMRNHLAL